MTFISVDDRPRALSALKDAIETAAPGARVVACASGEEALRNARECPVEVAFIDHKPVQFRYDKTREILAFLVDHRALYDDRQIISALWEKDVSGSYFRTLRKDLLDTFRQLGCEDIFIQQWGRLGIVPEKVSFDFYDWMAGRPEAMNAYLGKYMSQYEWAELTNAWVEKRESRR